MTASDAQERASAEPTAPLHEGQRSTRAIPTAVQVAETFLMVTAVGLGGLMVPGSWGLLEANPHPLWLVILAIAGRYGAPVGYLAAACSALVYAAFLWTWADRPTSELSTTELMPAFFMLLAGALLSELTSSRQRALTTAQAAMAEADQRAGALRQELDGASGVVDELKRRVLHQQQTLPALVEAGKRLQTLDAESVRLALPAVVARALDLPECALYRLQDRRLAGESSWPAAGKLPQLRVENAVVARSIAAKTAVSVRDLLQDTAASTLDGQPVLLAGPLLGVAEEVDSLLVITRMPAQRLNEQTRVEFQALLEWASLALRNCQLHEVTLGMGGAPAAVAPGLRQAGTPAPAAEPADRAAGGIESEPGSRPW